jgi:hypothetical protein
MNAGGVATSFSDATTDHPVGCSRPDLAICYFAGALACGTPAALLGHWAVLLAWPALALTAVACAYAAGWAGLFGKRDGRLGALACLALGPYVLGRRVTWWYQNRRLIPHSQLLPRLWIGRRPTPRDSDELVRRGVTSTLDLTAEFSEIPGRRGDGYSNLPLLDLTLPRLATLARAVAIIDDAISSGRGIYVHCALGYGRTAVVAAAYLLASGRHVCVDDAMAHVRSCRPGSVFSRDAAALLRSFSKLRVDSRTTP